MSYLVWSSSLLCGLSVLTGTLLLHEYLTLWLQRQKTFKRSKILEAQFTHALLMLSASLRAGMNLHTSLQQLSQVTPSPLRAELLYILNEQRIGTNLDTALENVSQRIPSANINMALSMMQIAQNSGGPLANALEKIAQTMRHQITMHDKVNALTAQGRLQGKILSFLPCLLMLVLQLIEPEAMNALWLTTSGWITLSIIFSLQILGIIAIKRLTRLDS